MALSFHLIYWLVASDTNGCYHRHTTINLSNGPVFDEKIAFLIEMDEQQGTFKVTDRRLFNADGSPRDLPPEEKPEAKLATSEPVSETPEEPQVEPPIAAAEPLSSSPQIEEAIDEEEELEGAQDPTSFVNFLMSIASNAASALGMMEHPVTHQREVDLELGKHWIDILGMLQKKTQGNLSKQEAQMLEGLLSDLRMQYVSLANATPKAPTFSGRAMARSFSSIVCGYCAWAAPWL